VLWLVLLRWLCKLGEVKRARSVGVDIPHGGGKGRDRGVGGDVFSFLGNGILCWLLTLMAYKELHGSPAAEYLNFVVHSSRDTCLGWLACDAWIGN
jgi:hypothetical protein